MNKLLVIFISLGLLGLISGDCFIENASSGEDCEKRAVGDDYCCFVEYRTNLDATYKKVCVPVKEDDIKDGKFEETITTIEGGNYTGSGWNETILSKFRNYSSIHEFDCKGNFVSNFKILAYLMIIIFLI